jgi:hypothetical protein
MQYCLTPQNAHATFHQERSGVSERPTWTLEHQDAVNGAAFNRDESRVFTLEWEFFQSRLGSGAGLVHRCRLRLRMQSIRGSRPIPLLSSTRSRLKSVVSRPTTVQWPSPAKIPNTKRPTSCCECTQSRRGKLLTVHHRSRGARIVKL